MPFRIDRIRRLPALVAVLGGLLSSACTAGDPERFGIFVSTLDGRNVQRILSDPEREINHARVSPDHKWITFTRYNNRSWNGIAKEEGGYMETEIMLVRPDGKDLQSLVPPRKGTVAANGYWTEDGRAILYVSNDNPERRGQINRIDLATRKVSTLAIDGNPWAADPHPVGKHLAISVFDPKEKKTSIWLAGVDGAKSRPITRPAMPADADAKTPLGDYDPKVSPDGSKVVAMRNLGKHNWHAVVVDLKTGEEKDISPEKSVDGVPEWSGDGRKLIFWHVDVKNLKRSGLYTMSPDGRDRQRIPLPGGYFYTMPAFFPGAGSDPGARIIFSAEKNPLL